MLHLENWELDTDHHQLTLSVSSVQVIAYCPVCNQPAHRVHSRYVRTLRDLPCVNFCLTILLQVCKFFCSNDDCQRRIFTERMPQVVLPWARRTMRFSEHLSAMGIALGGAAAARLSVQLNYDSSRNTFLRSVTQLALPPIKTPKNLGVDDFAFRKGHHYGTILVDLETHHPIALLPDRETSTLTDWLKEHPGVEILSRDRSKAYRAAAAEGAPHALQVADRFHLLQNLEEAVEKAFSAQSQLIKRVEQERWKQKQLEPPEAMQTCQCENDPKHTPSRARRLEKYEQVHALRKQGYKIKDIAYHLGMHKRSVYKFLSAPTFPEYKTHTHHRRSALNPFKPYLLEQWQKGRYNSKQLLEEIQQQGFKGTYVMVVRYTRKLRKSLPPQPTRESLNELPGRGPAPMDGVNHKPLTVHRAAWLVMRKVENLTPEEEEQLEQLSCQPELSVVIALAQSFLFLVRKRLPQHLDCWLKRAKESSVRPFESFAKGLIDDYEAVKAALTLDISNGPVEGQNNRLKMLKRQMFGRAGLDLLNKRLILNH